MASDGPDRSDAGATRVVLADDDVLLREGLASLLERAGFDVVGQGGTATLLELVRDTSPTWRSSTSGCRRRTPPRVSTRRAMIREEFPDDRRSWCCPRTSRSSTRWSCSPAAERIGYLLKSRVTDVDEFLDTLDRIATGGSVVDPALVQELVARAAARRSARRCSARASGRCWR